MSALRNKSADARGVRPMALRRFLALIVLLAAGCLLIPEDERTGHRIENVRPEVRITAGAATPDTAGIDYKVEFHWLGSDNDGVILRFEYAVDDTTTEDAWQDTTGFSALLKFKASHHHPYAPADTFSDWHTFYIRAVDNEYAASKRDNRLFNARTIAPATRITRPRIPIGAISLMKTFIVEWKGEDLDSSNPDRQPEFYEYKLIRLPKQYIAEELVVDSLSTKPNMMLDTLQEGDKTRWIRVPGNTRQRILRDLPATDAAVLVFAVRAVDEAGAVEPVLERGDNWIMFHVLPIESRPTVTMTERSLGAHVFPTEGDVWEVEVPTNTPIRFQWEGDESTSRPPLVNYALDIPDPHEDYPLDPRGIGGWIGWGRRYEVVIPFQFPDSENGQIHVFYLKMRDITEEPSSEQLCTVVMKVVGFTFEKTALLVDDAVIGYGLRAEDQDAVHDAFVDRFVGRMRAFAPQGIGTHSLYRPGGPHLKYPEGLNPTDSQRVPLSELARYQVLLWNFNYGGGGTTGLWFHEHEPFSDDLMPRRFLSSYLAAGGKIFIFGGRFLNTLMNPDKRVMIDYPKLPPQSTEGEDGMQFHEDGFIWRFLHVRNQIVGIDKYSCYGQPPDDHQTWRDGLIRCASVNPAYPDLVLDPGKWDPEREADCERPDNPPVGGIKDWEGVLFDRKYSPFFQEAGLDTLYVSEHYNWGGSPPTYWNGSVLAQRYEATAADTSQGLAHGRVILFMFQPYPFQEGPAIDAGTAAINWLMTGQDY
jgi:hypothetical protein